MRASIQNTTRGASLAAFCGAILLLAFTLNSARAFDGDYGSSAFGGSSYVQHGPSPAYGGAYGDYGANATGLEGRFSGNYNEYGAIPGYGRFGVASGYGEGPLRGAGTGQGRQASANDLFSRPQQQSAGQESSWKEKRSEPFTPAQKH